MSWNAKMIIQMAGIPIEDADDYLILLADDCAERFYYLDLATREFCRILDGPPLVGDHP